MFRVTLAGLRARITRTVMISLAIALAVAFVSATFSLTDALRASLYKQVAAQTGGREAPPPLLEDGILVALHQVCQQARHACFSSVVRGPV